MSEASEFSIDWRLGGVLSEIILLLPLEGGKSTLTLLLLLTLVVVAVAEVEAEDSILLLLLPTAKNARTS